MRPIMRVHEPCGPGSTKTRTPSAYACSINAVKSKPCIALATIEAAQFSVVTSYERAHAAL